MTTLNSLRSAFFDIQQPRPRSGSKSPHPFRGTARKLSTAAVCGLLLAAASPAGVHGLSDVSAAASDTLKVTLSAPDGGTVAEGATGHFEVSLAGSTAAGAVTVRYSVSGTATAGEDYTALSGEVTVAKGESAARIALEALDDGILDKGETVVLALTGATGPGTVFVDQTAATATILDDGSVTIALTAVADTIGEGSAWNSAVTMSTPVADRVSVRWWTTDGTAVAGRDYTAADEVVSFRPGETSKPVSVQTLKDDNAEAVEVFYVSLGPPPGAAAGAGDDVFKIDAKPQAGFIECSVMFPPPDPRVFRLPKPVGARHVIGTVAAETTPGIPYYELTDDDNKFTINSLTAQISTTASLDAGGFYELTVKVHDECGAQASVDVNVIVNGNPKAEGTISADPINVGESGMVDASKYFSDPDGNKLTYTATSSKPSVLGVSVSGSEVTYTGKAVGSATVIVTARDPGGLSATQSFDVKVKPKNDPPEANAGRDMTVTGPTTVTLDGTKSSDPNGDNLTYEWDGDLTLRKRTTPTPSFDVDAVRETTKYEFTLTVTDKPGLSDTDTVIVTVVPPECAIRVDDGDFEVPEDQPDVGTVDVTADHCGGLDYSVSGAGAEDVSVAAVSGSDADAEITGNFDFENRKSYGLTLTVSERGGSESASGSVDIMVTNVNEAPTANAGSNQTVKSNEPVTLNGTSSDLDDDHAAWGTPSHDFAWVRTEGPTPPGGLKKANTATATFKAPLVSKITDLVFELTVTDGGSLAHTDAVTVTVRPPPNQPPEFEKEVYSFTTDDTVSVGANVGRVRATDPEGGPVTYSLSRSSYFGIDPSSGWIAVKKPPPASTYSLTATATDSVDAKGTAEVEIKVNKVILPPDCTVRVDDHSFAVYTDETVVGTVQGSTKGSDCGSLRYELSGADAAPFSIGQSSGRVTVTGSLSVKTYAMTVRVRDGNGHDADAATLTVGVTVRPPTPVAPVFGRASYSWVVHDTVSAGHVVGTVTFTAI